jgi:hypothetical protein
MSVKFMAENRQRSAVGTGAASSVGSTELFTVMAEPL